MKYAICIIGLGTLLIIYLHMYSDKQADAIRVLSIDGVRGAEVDYAFWGCGEKDIFNISFSGVKNDKPVSGNVCSSFFKGQTIRYN